MISKLDYSEVYRYANDSMVIHDAVTGEILEANDAACRIYGRDLQTLRQMTVGELSEGSPEFSQRKAMEYIHAAAGCDQVITIEWLIRRSDGVVIPVQGTLKKMAGSARPMVLAMARDISEQKASEARLKERGRYFGELIRNSSDGIALISRYGIIQYLSASSTSMLGIPARLASGQNAFNYLHVEDARTLSGVLAKIRRGGLDAGTITYRVRHRHDGWRNHEAVFKNLLDDPAFEAVLINFRDITRRVLQDEKMRERDQQLNHYARLSIAGETAAALAHEVNQPLCAAVNFFAGCRRRIASGNVDVVEVSRALDMAQQELERAGKIIQSVRQFTSNHETSREVHSVRDIVNAISSFIEIRTHQDSVALAISINDDAFVECDEILIQQVICNLVVNGIEAMENLPDCERRLEISTKLLGYQVEVAVQDNGPGFPAQSLDEMPATFFTTKANGVGLGLSLSRAIVESHGGTLGFERVRPNGTRFAFVLPVAQRVRSHDSKQVTDTHADHRLIGTG